jgi:hypothetical protein
MPPFGRILKALGALVGALLYVWYEAVQAVPGVRRRKLRRGIGATARRASWRR